MELKGMYRLEYAGLTHPGKIMENNEDNFYIDGVLKKDTEENCFQAKGCVKNGHLVASVCDGMGGYASGEVSSLAAVQTLDDFCKKRIKEKNVLRDHALDYVNEANDRVCEIRKNGQKLTGSTLTVLEFADGKITAVNLGDSRIYRLREGKLEQISTDHSVVGRMVRMGQITPEEARVHPRRNQITQHLGIYPEEMLLEPAVVCDLDVQEKDRYLLCSDGLTDMVEDEKIAAILGKDETLEEIVRRLVQKAVDAGGRDNITALVIEVKAKGTLFGRLRKRF